MMAACWLKLGRVVTIFLVFSLMFNDVYQNTLNLQDNNAGISLEGFVVAGKLSSPSVAIPEVKTRRNSTAIASRPLIPASRKLMMGVYVLKIALSTNILLLSGDIALNPGPVNLNVTFSSNESMMPGILRSTLIFDWAIKVCVLDTGMSIT
jgi:hypothetical protein